MLQQMHQQQRTPMWLWLRPMLIFPVLVSSSQELKQSTEQLVDANPFCADWAEQGECDRNPAFMLRDCARSCAASIVAHGGATDTFGTAVSTEQHEQRRHVQQQEQGLQLEQGQRQEQQSQQAQSQPGEAQQQRDQHNRSAADGHQGLASSPATATSPTQSFSAEEVELRITEARTNSFTELHEAHEQDCRETLWRAWRMQQEELERITSEAREREAILEGRLKAAMRRADEAEAQVQRFSSGEERRSLEGRIQQLARALERTEVQAMQSEDSLATCMQDLDRQASASASKVAMARQRVLRLQRSCLPKQRCRRLQSTSRQRPCGTADASSSSDSSGSCTAQLEQLSPAPESLAGLQDHVAPPKGTARLLVATVGTVVLQFMALALWRLLAASGASGPSREPLDQ